jgi:hypothetical protein
MALEFFIELFYWFCGIIELMINFFIGFIVGSLGVVAYFQRIRKGTILELKDNQVALYRFTDSPPQVKELSDEIYYFTSPPEVMTLMVNELTYSFTKEGSVSCRDYERIDITINIRISPKKEISTLNELLTMINTEQLFDTTWQKNYFFPYCQGSLTKVQTHDRKYWLDNPHQLQANLQEYINKAVPQWECSLNIVSLEATNDKHYNNDNPEEQACLLQRITLQESNEELKEMINKNEELLKKHKDISSQFTESEKILQIREAKLKEREEALNNAISTLQTNIHSQMEVCKSDIQKELGNFLSQSRKDLASQGNALPNNTKQAIQRQKNELLSQVDQKKREQLNQTESLYPTDDASSE